MTLKLKITSLTLLFSAFIFAQDLENSLLWEISNPENNQTSYLYGTMHLGCNVELSDEIKNVFQEVDLLLLEIDITNPNMASEIKNQMFMKDGKTLLDLISEEEYYILSNYVNPRLAPQGINLEVMKNVKPVLLSTMLMQNLIECESKGSFDMELARLAQEIGIEIQGLETIERQMKVFEQIPEEQQIEMLLKSAREDGVSDKEQLNAMMDAYRSNDLNTLQMLAKEDQGMFIEFEDELITKRNMSWIPLLKKYITGYQVMIGVGALHLVGEQGVINLLREEGFEVKPVR